MYRVSWGVKAIGCTQFFHKACKNEEEVAQAIRTARKESAVEIKISKSVDVTAEFI